MKKVGDIVYFLGQKCKIVDIERANAENNFKQDLLKVKFLNGETRTIVDSLLDKQKPENISAEKKANNSKKISEILEKVDEIFDSEKISSCKSEKEAAFELFKYVINNSNYDEKRMEEKKKFDNVKDLEIDEIYHCLCKGKSVCTGDCSTLSLLYRMYGITSRHVTIADKGEGYQGIHEVVLMYFDNQEYICDPTLVRTSLENKKIPEVDEYVFAFTPNNFFKILYRDKKEIKYIHEPLTLDNQI